MDDNWGYLYDLGNLRIWATCAVNLGEHSSTKTGSHLGAFVIHVNVVNL